MAHDHDHDHQHHHDPEDEAEARRQADILRAVLSKLPRPVPVVLYGRQGEHQPYVAAARQALESLSQYSDQIVFRQEDLDSEAARAAGITESPTLVLDPENYAIRWLGAPIGEESSALIEAVIMLGYRKTGLGGQARKLLKGIDSPREIRLFVSPTCPYCPQQILNALMAAIERPGLISLEIVDVQAMPHLADRYDAFSTPTAHANGRLIARGAQPEELFMASLAELEQVNVFIPDDDAEEVATDLVIVGGGPAGLTAAIYAARAGLKAVVVEKGTLGGQVATTPTVENYPGFNSVGGKTLVDILVSHALEYCHIYPGEEVMAIEPGETLVVSTNRRRFTTRAVLLATGASHRHLGVPGEERLAGRGVSYCATCDAPLFKGKQVILVGGGDSAVTEALHLSQVGASVTLVHRRDQLRAQARLQEQLKSAGVEVLYHTRVGEIRGQERVTSVELVDTHSEEARVVEAEGVFAAIGYDPAVDLARRLGVELSEDGYIQRDQRHRTNIPGVYSAGDVEGGYKQIVTAAGQGAEAALAIFEDLLDPYWTRERQVGGE